MRVVVNGEAREVPESATVAELLTRIQVAPERVVVEVNLTILRRATYADTRLHDGDQVEIVRFIGGGESKNGVEFRVAIQPETCNPKPETRC